MLVGLCNNERANPSFHAVALSTPVSCRDYSTLILGRQHPYTLLKPCSTTWPLGKARSRSHREHPSIHVAFASSSRWWHHIHSAHTPGNFIFRSFTFALYTTAAISGRSSIWGAKTTAVVWLIGVLTPRPDQQAQISGGLNGQQNFFVGFGC